MCVCVCVCVCWRAGVQKRGSLESRDPQNQLDGRPFSIHPCQQMKGSSRGDVNVWRGPPLPSTSCVTLKKSFFLVLGLNFPNSEKSLLGDGLELVVLSILETLAFWQSDVRMSL